MERPTTPQGHGTPPAIDAVRRELHGAPIELLLRLAPVALENARWIAANPAAAFDDFERCRRWARSGTTPAPRSRLDDAQFPWYRLGFESFERSTRWFEGPLDLRFWIAGDPAGELYLGEDEQMITAEEFFSPLVAWANRMVALGEAALGVRPLSPPTDGPEIEDPSPAAAAAGEAPTPSEWSALAVMDRVAVHPKTISSEELAAAMSPAGNAAGTKLTPSRCKQLLAELVRKGWATKERRRWCLSAEQRDAYRKHVLDSDEN